MKICYRFGIPFSDLVTKGEVCPKFELKEQFQMLNQNRSKSVCRSVDLARRGLLAALAENPTPSLRVVADRLGYKLTRSLYIRYPDLTKMLTAKLRKSGPTAAPRLPTKEPDEPVPKLALQKALEMAFPPSLSAIAANLGQDTTGRIRNEFPDLCDAILSLRSEYFQQHQNDIRQSLNLVLLEDPPPSPAEVSKRIGYRTQAGLNMRYPEKHKAILKRYRKYQKEQYEGIRQQLKAASKEDPPPSLRELMKRLQKKYLYLHEHFPNECRAVVNRYAQFMKKSHSEKKAQAKARMKRLAFELHKNGHLTLVRLREVSGRPTGLDWPELATVLREVKREMKLQKRG